MSSATISSRRRLPPGVLGLGCALLLTTGLQATGVLATGLQEPGVGPPEPSGYRMDHYRSPTPRTLEGARVIETAELLALPAADRPILIDTTPLGRTGLTDFDGTWIKTAERWNLPGSLWLPNVGYGYLDATIEAFFVEQLAKATGGDPGRPILFYCYLDCWMSWNAAKRALELGYEQVFWYPSGSDGWREAGAPLALGEPVPLVLEQEIAR